MEQIDIENGAWLRKTAPRLVALLLHYNSRPDGGEVYLAEGSQITGAFGRFCAAAGLSLPEALRMFLPFRRSILEAIFESGTLNDCEDDEGRRLFQRTEDFLDALMLSLIGSFQQYQHVNRKEPNQCS
jgi:hypothetical protein